MTKMRGLLFSLLLALSTLGFAQADKAQQYLREAQQYNEQAEKYEREAQQLTNKANDYTRQAENYARKKDFDQSKRYSNWANDAMSKAQLRLS